MIREKKSNDHESDLWTLRLAKVGATVEVAKMEVTVRMCTVTMAQSGKAFASCAFGTDLGAAGCIYREACIAHLRPDRKSVYFEGKEGV